MDYLCSRCVRSALRIRSARRPVSVVRNGCSFSSSSRALDDNRRDTSTGVSTSPRPSFHRLDAAPADRRTPVSEQQNSTARRPEGQLLIRRQASDQRPEGQLLIRRQASDQRPEGQRPGVQRPVARRPEGQRPEGQLVIRRHAVQDGTAPGLRQTPTPGQVLRRSPAPTGAAPQVLRRTSPPSRSGPGPSRTSTPGNRTPAARSPTQKTAGARRQGARKSQFTTPQEQDEEEEVEDEEEEDLSKLEERDITPEQYEIFATKLGELADRGDVDAFEAYVVENRLEGSLHHFFDPENTDPDLVDLFSEKHDLENYMQTVIDPPLHPRTPQLHNPEPVSLDTLRQDWPNTPMSAVGLAESVTQKIEGIARRLPHGKHSPEELADRYHRGNLIRFTSEDEKAEVIRIATEMSKERAEYLTERAPKLQETAEKLAAKKQKLHPQDQNIANQAGQVIEPENMAFEGLVERNSERLAIMKTMIQGEYPALEKQRMPFMDNVARTLRNNGSYSVEGSSKFMDKIQTIVAARNTRPAART